MKTIRTQVLLKLIKPYTHISIEYLASEHALNIPQKDVEDLCVSLILDGVLKGQIDQIDQMLHLEREGSTSSDKYAALDKWTRELQALTESIEAKLAATTS